jgi:tetratricopeptide (TPR) repeat protein
MRQAVWERDQKEAALREVESFAQKVTLANELVARGESMAANDQLGAAEAAFDAAVSQQSSYYLPWISRGQFLARQQRWAAAAGDFSQALKLGADTETPQWWGVPAIFELGNDLSPPSLAHDALQTYFRRYSERLSEVLADDVGLSQEVRWEWIRNGLISGSVLSKVHYQQIAQWTDRMLAKPPRRRGSIRRGPDHRTSDRRISSPLPGDRRPPPRRDDDRFRGEPHPPPADLLVPLPRPVQFYITGLAHLRAGNDKRSIEVFEEAADMRWPNSFLLHAPLAMAYANQGKMNKAREQMALAQVIATELQSSADIIDRFVSAPWFDLAEFHVLHAEAKQRLTP